ncbi:sulfate adenylyltransferase subunit CysN [uncultured Sneathiella sp.]|uniref:sulfate adenylyltransferase subunit CysN n=1 Tax=uncultured Sneathiella sp. TaxID=879315 RepID=UPI0030EC31D1|tara:strand:- start:34781 stop:36679 length:1899 start_codon:yes stop_codon:yes gene_type:complete
MNDLSNAATAEIDAYLKTQEQKNLLRFITCGSVDDGKSTFIGRLLWDSKLLFEDQLAALTAESKRAGTQNGDIDYALLLDGLQAEREQGITIDVAYRFFATDKRKFIVADTPGHEQYTRNMVTGASTADLAVILIDARKGVLIQTMRHSYLVSLLGIKKVVLAVNKMDLVDYDEAVFTKILDEYTKFAEQLNFEEITPIPVSALKGDNMIGASDAMPWYDGPSVLEHLETVHVSQGDDNRPFRFPVQWVNRPNLDFRGFSGTVASGSIRIGDPIVEPASGQSSKVARIVTFDGDLKEASKGQAITLTLEDEIDISRGDILCATKDRPATADQFEAKIVWMNAEPMLPSRTYLLKLGTGTTAARISSLKYKVNVNTMEHTATKTLELNEIGVCNLSLDKAISFDPYADIPETGSFILIDRFTNATVAAGMIDFALRRADNIHWQSVDIHKEARAEQKGQKASVLWFTGLSGSGKSTIANLVEKKLHSLGKHTYLLDGDNVRHGLNKDLGFTDADRVENIRRVGETAKLMVDAGLITLVSFISPFRSERQMARGLLEEGEFLEVFVDTPLEICEARDIKGLYKKARAGEIKNFTGISSDYERPENAEIIIDGGKTSPEDAADQIIATLEMRGFI